MRRASADDREDHRSRDDGAGRTAGTAFSLGARALVVNGTTIYEGTSEVQRIVIARSLLA